MLTINHRLEGVDRIYQATEVQYYGPFSNFGPEGVTMTGLQGDGVEEPLLLSAGLVYVMNDAGATVAKYDLGPVKMDRLQESNAISGYAAGGVSGRQAA